LLPACGLQDKHLVRDILASLGRCKSTLSASSYALAKWLTHTRLKDRFAVSLNASLTDHDSVYWLWCDGVLDALHLRR